MWSFWNKRTERGPRGSPWYENINLKLETINILGIHFSYNEFVAREKFFLKAIFNIQGVYKLWRMISLTIEERIVIFKTLAISKIVYLTLLTNTLNIDELEKIQKKFIWNNSTPKLDVWIKECRYSDENNKPSMFLYQETLW